MLRRLVFPIAFFAIIAVLTAACLSVRTQQHATAARVVVSTSPTTTDIPDSVSHPIVIDLRTGLAGLGRYLTVAAWIHNGEAARTEASRHRMEAAHTTHLTAVIHTQAAAPAARLSTTNPSMCGWNDRSCWRNVGQTVGSINGYPCGGDLPSCCTLRFESGGNPTAQNPSSSASGLWQFMHDTWNGFGGVSEAKYADATTQNTKARQAFAGGAGWGAWRGDGCYPGG